jgi:hypothetical protein
MEFAKSVPLQQQVKSLVLRHLPGGIWNIPQLAVKNLLHFW